MAAIKNLTVRQGSTFSYTLRWEAPPIIYRAISAISQTAPVRITCNSHGVPDGWRVAIVSVKGMTQINARNNPPKNNDYHKATVIDANTLEINDINAADFKPYISGGYVMYNTPVDMTGYTARMSIKDKIGGDELLRLDTSNSRIIIDNVNKTIKLTISATDTAAISWRKGVYDLELVSPSGFVETLMSGRVDVIKEITST